MARPALVFMRARKPNCCLRVRLEGWYVRFIKLANGGERLGGFRRASTPNPTPLKIPDQRGTISTPRRDFSGWQEAMPVLTIRSMARNILGGDLEPCCYEPVTGFFRDGYCHTGPGDSGVHTVCAVMTKEFLKYSFEQGNDLSTPRPDMQFPGLKPGDRWCLCASRWTEAFDAGMAPKIRLESTHASTLEFANIEDLKACAAE